MTTDAYDFKGNLLRSQRQLAREYKATLDWSTAVPLEPEIFTSSTRYDALNRPTEQIAPDNSVYRPTFNEANLLDKVDVNLRGAAVSHALRHQHRLQRQGPAHAHRLRQRRQDDLRIRSADLPPDPSDDHPAGRAERPRDAALQECRHRAGPALHLRPGRQHHPHR